ncbi:MAG: DUF1501 domain-containing protein [Chloroflexi bacterium]|nr:MAG: DUF1501 domain-containing protein [Chloroflexota bacterium]
MMKLTRRAMIKDGFLAVSAGMIMPSIFSRGIASARAQSIDGSRVAQMAGDRTLIVVQMAGGNDGLNTVIPFGDPLYHQMRPTLSIPDTSVIHLDTRLGLHPNLAPLKQLWDDGHLAIVEGVGYPNQSLSHFQAMDIWQTLDLNGTGNQGWLGKLVSGWVDQDGHPFKAMDIGVQTAQALASISAPVPTISSVNTYRIYPDPADVDNGNARLQALMKLYNSYPETSPYAALLDTTALSAQDGSKQLRNADAQYQAAVTYPQGPFASKHGKADNVVVMTWSEFGRRVEENGSQGTDHGTAAPMFVMGNTVNRGTFGEPPNLGNLDNNGNLKYTTDFRSVYATILDRWLGASSHDVLGGSFGSQNFLPQP